MTKLSITITKLDLTAALKRFSNQISKPRSQNLRLQRMKTKPKGNPK